MSLRGELFGDLEARPETARGAALGDIVCWDSDCDYGRNATRELAVYFVGAGSPDRYRLAVEAIRADANALEERVHLPFSNYCCAWKTLGQRAEKLTEEIARSTGQAPPPHDPAGDPGVLERFGGLIALAAVLGVIAVAASAGAKRLAGRKEK